VCYTTDLTAAVWDTRRRYSRDRLGHYRSSPDQDRMESDGSDRPSAHQVRTLYCPYTPLLPLLSLVRNLPAPLHPTTFFSNATNTQIDIRIPTSPYYRCNRLSHDIQPRPSFPPQHVSIRTCKALHGLSSRYVVSLRLLGSNRAEPIRAW
jgi:hypothetical protein